MNTLIPITRILLKCMIVNFKGDYIFQESLLQFKFFFNEFIQHKEWTLSMDNVNGAHGFSGHRIVCLDIVQGISGQCPHFPMMRVHG